MTRNFVSDVYKIDKKQFAIKRMAYNSLLKCIMKDLNDSVCPRSVKRAFLCNYGAILNVEYALKRTQHFNLLMFIECLEKDKVFAKIYSFFTLTKHENLEFMMLCKSGYYGEVLQKKYAHINESVIKKLLDTYAFERNSFNHTLRTKDMMMPSYIDKQTQAKGGQADIKVEENDGL